MHLHFKVNQKRKRGRHRTKRRNLLHHVREYIWPTIGWMPWFRHMEIQVKRTAGSIHSVAFGLAAGVFVTFTPFVGLQSAMVLLLCFFFRGHYLIGIVGTFLGNPWTFPFIWVAIYKFGNFLMGIDKPPPIPDGLSPHMVLNNLDYYFDNFIWPMTVGGVPMGLLAGAVTYALVYVNVMSYRKIRLKRLQARRTRWQHIRARAVEVGSQVGQKIAEKRDAMAEKREERAEARAEAEYVRQSEKDAK